MRGFSDPYGSWNTIWTRRLYRRSALAPQRPHVLAPSNTICPASSVDQPHQRPRQRRLAAAGLAHHRQRLAALDGDATRRPARAPPGCRARQQRRAARAGRENARSRSSARSSTVMPPCTASARMQALSWPGATASSVFSPMRQASTASGQRGANRQPGGNARGSGGAPGMPLSRGARMPRTGQRAQQPERVGMRRPAKDRWQPAPLSITRPAYSTATRSHVSATTPRSCVTSTTLIAQLRPAAAAAASGSGPGS